MRVTLELPDDFAQKVLADIPQENFNSYLATLLMQNYQAKNPTKKRLHTLPFPTLPSRGGVVTNELVNQLREQEGI